MAACSELAGSVSSAVRRRKQVGGSSLEARSATAPPEVADLSFPYAGWTGGAQASGIGGAGLETGNETTMLARIPDGWTQVKSAV